MGWRDQGTDIILRGGTTGIFSIGDRLPDLPKALETGTFLHRGPVKYQGRVRLPVTLKDS